MVYVKEIDFLYIITITRKSENVNTFFENRLQFLCNKFLKKDLSKQDLYVIIVMSTNVSFLFFC